MEISHEVKPVVYEEGAANGIIQCGAHDYGVLLTNLAEIFVDIPYEKRESLMNCLHDILESYFTRTDESLYRKLTPEQYMREFNKVSEAILAGESYLAYTPFEKGYYPDPDYLFYNLIEHELRNDWEGILTIINKEMETNVERIPQNEYIDIEDCWKGDFL